MGLNRKGGEERDSDRGERFFCLGIGFMGRAIFFFEIVGG